MESVLSLGGAGFCHNMKPLAGLGESKRTTITGTQFNNNSCSFGGIEGKRQRRMVVVKAEAVSINPDIRKSEEKVVDSVVVTELSKPLTAYCR